MWWKHMLFLVCAAYIFMCGRAKHIYKCHYQNFDEKAMGIILGSVLGTLTECAAAWYIIECMFR